MSETANSVSFDVPAYMRQLGARAREASRRISRAETGDKNTALLAIADAVVADAEHLAAENRKDLEAGRQRGLDAALGPRRPR